MTNRSAKSYGFGRPLALFAPLPALWIIVRSVNRWRSEYTSCRKAGKAPVVGLQPHRQCQRGMPGVREANSIKGVIRNPRLREYGWMDDESIRAKERWHARN